MTPTRSARPFGDDLKEVGQILGDPTRIDMLQFVTRSPEPVTALDVSTEFGLHQNAARHHLAKLENVGLIIAKSRRNPAGGRPAKVYMAGSRCLQLHYPGRQYLLMSNLLLRVLATTEGATRSRISQVAAESGRQLASDVVGSSTAASSFMDSVNMYLSVLEHLGYMTRTQSIDEPSATIANSNCVYADLGPEHGIKLCSICNGLLSGIASEVGLSKVEVSEERINREGEECRMTLTH